MSENKIKIISIFESIDGEVNAFYQGALTTFIRLSGCNLRCSYCDTTYSFSGGNDMSVTEIVDTVARLKPKKVTITGGEPLLQIENLKDLIEVLLEKGYLVSVETNGTLPIPESLLFMYDTLSWVFDYKLPSSKMESKMVLDHFKDLETLDIVKFVINDKDDFNRALEVRKTLDNVGCRAKYAYSPVFGVYPTATLVDDLIKEGVGDEIVSLQLHKVIWPNCGATEER